MLMSGANRLFLRRLLRSRIAKVLLLIFCAVNFLDVMRIHQKVAEGESIRRQHHVSRSKNQERIYIASMHFNDALTLHTSWISEVLRLTEVLGPENVFVSVYESGSWDNTKQLLHWLDDQLEQRKVPRNVVTSDRTHEDELSERGTEEDEGWVRTPEGNMAPRRIPFLARLRNKTLQDLLDLHEKGVKFDKVLFLNDVVFTAEDVLALLDTNEGEYAAACSLDFALPPWYYDTFALRDSEQQPHAMLTWPYLRAAESRNAIVNSLDAVPVSSCWNGIVAMPAEPFVSSTKLRFRAIPDSLAARHLEGSECCLIHADNPLSRSRGVYLNPRVRVGYDQAAYAATHPEAGGSWLSAWSILRGLWSNRVRRWTTWPLKHDAVRKRVQRWEKEDPANLEPGDFCVIDEMHILVHNGWAHV